MMVGRHTHASMTTGHGHSFFLPARRLRSSGDRKSTSTVEDGAEELRLIPVSIDSAERRIGRVVGTPSRSS